METQKQPSIRSILSSINLVELWDMCPGGVVIFQKDLTILHSNSRARVWLAEAKSLDQAIAKGVIPPDPKPWRELAESVLQGQTHLRTPVIRYTNEAETHLLRLSWFPLRESEPEMIIGGAVLIEDITIEADLQQQLAQSHRLASVGKVAGKVAHELNNPLDGILRYINLALRVIDQGQPDKAREYLLHGRTGLMRMVQIVGEMLEFSRNSGPAMEPTPLEQILRESIGAMEPKAGKVRIELLRPDPQPLPRFRADNLFQVFCNLIKNAFDAMDGDGQLTIAIRRNGSLLEIDFCDTGPGFPTEHAEAMFQPFFTTKGFGRGTGLGLAICRDLVDKLRGRITAANRPEGGSVFTVSLPVGEETHK